jgi:DNA-binding transcriptional LysR family regulator
VLDLRLLHQALVLERHRNFARAAEALHLTQPALSRSIAGLEAALGERLFDRTHQGVEPTSFGRMLLARARTLVDDAAEVERDFQLFRGMHIGTLAVGAGVFPTALSVGHAAGALMGRHPRLNIELSSGDLRSMVAQLLQRKLDLAVIELSMAEEQTGLATEALPEHPGCFFCRDGHPLGGQPRPSLKQVLAFPYVGPRLPPRVGLEFLQLVKVGRIDADSGDYLPPVKVESLSVAIDVVRHSDAVGLAPLALLAPEIRAGRLLALPLRLDWMHTHYGFVYLRDRQLSPAAQAFMTEVRTVEHGLAAVAQSLLRAIGPTAAAASRTDTKTPDSLRITAARRESVPSKGE